MNKCFITKLPSSVDNDNLPVLGQLRIKWLQESNLTDNAARAISVLTSDSITLKVSGAYFTDDTLTSNLGNTKTVVQTDGKIWLYISNNADAVLTIDNKYSLVALDFVYPNKDFIKKPVYFDIEDIKYCTNLVFLSLWNTKVSGDISALSNLTNCKQILLNNTQVSGDISALSNLTNLTNLHLANTKIIGDISALSNLTNLTYFQLANTKIIGDISALSNLTNLTYFQLDNTKVIGDINSLSNLTKLDSFDINGLFITGDMSKIPANTNYVYQNNRPISYNFAWTANGRQNATLLAMGDAIPFDTASMDNMLIDQATCTVSPDATQSYKKIISVKGTRTSASDAAVTAIQNKGITIIGVNKES